MAFHVLDLAVDTVRELRPLHAELRRRDPRLARQLRDAASSIALNLGEGNRRTGKDRTQLWRVAAGSAEEVRIALRVAQAWGDLDERRLTEALGRIDRILRILWKLTS